MATFNNLSRYKVSVDATVRYDLGVVLGQRDGKDVTAIVLVTMANELNPSFLNEVLKASPNQAKGRALNLATASASQKAAMLREAREEDKRLFARLVVRGWENVFSDDGKEQPFSPEECVNLFEALPDHIFDGLRRFCQDPENFVATDASQLAKN